MRSRRWIVRVVCLSVAVVAGGAFALAMSADEGSGPDRATPPDRVTAQEAGRQNATGGSASRFFGVTTPAGPYNFDELEQFRAAAGTDPAVFMFSQDWQQGPISRELLDGIADRGMVPMITWEPRDHTAPARAEQPDFALARILDGTWDAYIREWAAGIRDAGRPVALRFGQQMNGDWFPWAEAANGNRPGEYADAWRYVRRIFTEIGATNVTWVWSVNVSYTGSVPLAGLYPGDEYVDWVGIDGYNGGSDLPWGGWISAERLFAPTMSEIRAFTAKPFVLTEVASTEGGGDKATWIKDFLTMAQERPDILGFVWVEAAREVDWRIVSSAEAARAFAAGVGDARFISAAAVRELMTGG